MFWQCLCVECLRIYSCTLCKFVLVLYKYNMKLLCCSSIQRINSNGEGLHFGSCEALLGVLGVVTTEFLVTI